MSDFELEKVREFLAENLSNGIFALLRRLPALQSYLLRNPTVLYNFVSITADLTI